MLENVSQCLPASLNFDTSEESVAAWVQPLFGLVAITQPGSIKCTLAQQQTYMYADFAEQDE